MKKGLLIFVFSSLLFCASYAQDFHDYYSVERITLDDGSQVDKVIISGPPNPPEGYDIQIAYPTDDSVILSDVPAFDWVYGCSATSAAMQAGYYDRTGYPNMYSGPTNGGVMPLDNSSWGYMAGECPLSATHMGYDGLAVRGHVDDYWVSYLSGAPDPYITGGWTQHDHADCTGDFMKTNQSAYGNVDGATTFWYYTDGSAFTWFDAVIHGVQDQSGMYGLKLFYESRGYNVTNAYNQYRLGYNGVTQGITFADYKAEIDDGKPVLIHVEGHTMLGYGYDDSGSVVYLHNTWDYNSHSMTWGGSYSGMAHVGATIITIESGQTPPDPPQNVTTEIIGTEVHLSWNAVTGATSYKVYSSNDPNTGFLEDTSGTFDGTSWSTSIVNEKKFYYVIAIN